MIQNANFSTLTADISENNCRRDMCGTSFEREKTGEHFWWTFSKGQEVTQFDPLGSGFRAPHERSILLARNVSQSFPFRATKPISTK